MTLTEEKSICEKKQKIIISAENGRKHQADNTKKKAYFIELKGRNVSEAVDQLEAGKKKVEMELQGYEMHFRIVASKINTHEINSTHVRKLIDKYKGRLRYKSVFFEEDL